MADDKGNDHEEAGKRCGEENLTRSEDLGIGTISKSLLEVVNSEHKLLSYHRSSKQKRNLEASEVRLPSRARNVVSSYNDDIVDDVDLRSYGKRYARRSYTEVRAAANEEHKRAVMKAENIRCNLNPDNPSFVKSMVRSNVSSCFWLGLPSRFCQDHLPSNEVKMVLEDENGCEYEAIYIGRRNGLSGGWRGFSIDHKLDDGDVLVFELCQPSRFKVYIVKATGQSTQDNDDKPTDDDRGRTDQSAPGKTQLRTGSSKRVKSVPKRSDLM